MHWYIFLNWCCETLFTIAAIIVLLYCHTSRLMIPMGSGCSIPMDSVFVQVPVHVPKCFPVWVNIFGFWTLFLKYKSLQQYMKITWITVHQLYKPHHGMNAWTLIMQCYVSMVQHSCIWLSVAPQLKQATAFQGYSLTESVHNFCHPTRSFSTRSTLGKDKNKNITCTHYTP